MGYYNFFFVNIQFKFRLLFAGMTRRGFFFFMWSQNLCFPGLLSRRGFVAHPCSYTVLEDTIKRKQLALNNIILVITWRISHLRDFVCDVVRPVFDFRCNDGLLWRRRGRALLFVVDLREVEGDQWDFVDGAVLVEVGVGRGTEQAGLDVAERPWERERQSENGAREQPWPSAAWTRWPWSDNNFWSEPQHWWHKLHHLSEQTGSFSSQKKLSGVWSKNAAESVIISESDED